RLSLEGRVSSPVLHSFPTRRSSDLAAVRDRVPEAHLEGPQAPGDEHEAEADEREHHAVDRPALLHHAPVKDGQSGDAHQPDERRDRKSTRLNSSHVSISYAVFCLKK